MREPLSTEIKKLKPRDKIILLAISRFVFFRIHGGWRQFNGAAIFSLDLVKNLTAQGFLTTKPTRYSRRLALTALGQRAVAVIEGRAQG